MVSRPSLHEHARAEARTPPGAGVEIIDPADFGGANWRVRVYSSVISNEDGTWVATDGWGYQQPEDGPMLYARHCRGTDAYEGLSALFVLPEDSWSKRFDVEGVIFPGDLPEAPQLATEAASGSD